MLRAAAVLYWVLGTLQLGAAALIVGSLMSSGRLPVVFGITWAGGGFLEPLGREAMLASQLVWVAVNAMGLVAGVWLWRLERRGGRLAVGLLPFQVFFVAGHGFPPGALIVVPLRIALVAAGWRTLR